MKNKVKITPIQGPYNIMPILPPNLGSYGTDYASYLLAYKLYVQAVLDQRKYMNALSKAREAARPKKNSSDSSFNEKLKQRIKELQKETIITATEYKQEERVIPGKPVDKVVQFWYCKGSERHKHTFPFKWCTSRTSNGGTCSAFAEKVPQQETIKSVGDSTITLVDVPVEVPKKVIIDPTPEEVEKIKHELRHERAVEKRRRWRLNKAKRAQEKAKEEITKLKGSLSKSEPISQTTAQNETWTEVKRKTKKPKVSKPVEIVYESVSYAREITQLRLMKADERLHTLARLHKVSRRELCGNDGRKTFGPWEDQRFVKWQDMITEWALKQDLILSGLPSDSVNFTCPKLRPFRDPILSKLC